DAPECTASNMACTDGEGVWYTMSSLGTSPFLARRHAHAARELPRTGRYRRGRSRPSWTTETARRPSRVQMWPMAKPRAPVGEVAVGLDPHLLTGRERLAGCPFERCLRDVTGVHGTGPVEKIAQEVAIGRHPLLERRDALRVGYVGHRLLVPGSGLVDVEGRR